MKNQFISVTKQIIRAAAKLGVEEAGTRIMGSAWGPFKAILTPVFDELEKRYPNFFLLEVPKGITPPSEAQLASEKAILALETDHQLQQMLQDGFNKLEHGQFEIKNQISKIELRLEAIDISIDDLSSLTDDRFESVLSQLTMISEKLDSVGKSVEVENKSILVPLAFDLPKGSIEAFLTIYIPGIEPIQLSVDKNRPHTTINILFPRPGKYTYRIDHNEITKLYKQVGNDFIPELLPINSVDNNEVEIVPNSIYIFERSYKFIAGGTGQLSMYLTKKLTKEEEQKMHEEEEELLDLDDLDKLLS